MKTNNLPSTFMYALFSLKRRMFRETTLASVGVYLAPAIDQAAEQFRSTMRQDILWGLNGRFERGVALANQGAVSPHTDPNNPDKRHLFQVKSANQSRPPFHYLVDLEAGTCECPDHWKGHFCKHRIASHIIEIFNYNRQIAVSSEAQVPLTTITSEDNQVQPSANAPVTEEVPSNSEPGVETNAVMPKDSIIWGVIKHGGQWLGVEVLALEDDNATIRALPIIAGKKLQPQFPFEGKRCTITIPKKHLFHVKIFQ